MKQAHISQRSNSRSLPNHDPITCEVEVIPGLEDIATDELRRRFRQRVTILPSPREGTLPILYDGDLSATLDLETVLAVYGRRMFPVPRPKALLGHEAFTTLLSMIDVVRELHPAEAFQTFRISAAGVDSPVIQRMRAMLTSATGLIDTTDEGELLIRLRRAVDAEEGWDVLIRLSPRPLSARPWRVCNLPGALNASVAHAMARLTQPHPDDFVVNLASGSGTLLIERLNAAPARIALGCDIDPLAVQCACENAAASEHSMLRFEQWDAGATPLPDACADALLADLPFGQVVGSHEQNLILYPRILREAARVTVRGGLFAAITQDIRLWERLVTEAGDWKIEATLPIKIPFSSGYLHPRIFLLRRR